MTDQVIEKCAKHARVAARQVKMKSLDPGKCGVAFLAEGLKLIFNVDDTSAYTLAQVCTGRAAELLIERSINLARQNGASEAELACLRAYAIEAEKQGPEQWQARPAS